MKKSGINTTLMFILVVLPFICSVGYLYYLVFSLGFGWGVLGSAQGILELAHALILWGIVGIIEVPLMAIKYPLIGIILVLYYASIAAYITTIRCKENHR
jgi:predicted membrane protein